MDRLGGRAEGLKSNGEYERLHVIMGEIYLLMEVHHSGNGHRMLLYFEHTWNMRNPKSFIVESDDTDLRSCILHSI